MSFKVNESIGWGSHQPLLYAMMEVLEPQFVLELGVGMHSTPIFLDSSCQKIISIETNLVWIEYVKSRLRGMNKLELIHHKLDDRIKDAAFLRDLSVEQMKVIVNYYDDMLDAIDEKKYHPKLLFVDNLTCCRNLAINTMFSFFDAIIYHDCEPNGILWYEYGFSGNLLSEYDQYVLEMSNQPWTGCFIKGSDSGARLENCIGKYIDKYIEEVGPKTEVISLEKF